MAPCLWSRSLGLSAGHAHVPGDSRPLMFAVDDEVVALRLPRDRFVDRGVDDVVSLRSAERRPQICGILLTEAHKERAGAGHPEAVAAFAEIVGERCSEPQPAAGFGYPHISRRSAGLVRDVF